MTQDKDLVAVVQSPIEENLSEKKLVEPACRIGICRLPDIRSSNLMTSQNQNWMKHRSRELCERGLILLKQRCSLGRHLVYLAVLDTTFSEDSCPQNKIL